MRTMIFKIEGMNCDGCAKTIQILIERESGVRMASVSFNERAARVLYDPQSVQESRLIDLIQKRGFRMISTE